jgi:glucosylceramidase
MIHDHNRDRVEAFADAVLTDPSASQYVDGVAFHWYVDGDYHRLVNIHEKYPNVFLLPTEACFLDGVHIDDYDRGEQYGIDIIKDLNHFAGGWVDWNLVVDPHGGPCHSVLRVDAPIIGDYINQTLHYQPMYFYLGQFTKFIPVGSVRVHVEANVIEDVHVTAFKRPDNTVVLVVLNNGHKEVSFKIQDHDIQQVAHAKVHPHGIKTFIWKKA